MAEIKALTELTISYIDHSMPRHLRHQRLTQDYGFHCQCQICCDSKERLLDDKYLIGYKCCRGEIIKKGDCPGFIAFHGSQEGLCDTCGKASAMAALPHPSQSGSTRLLHQLWDIVHSVADDNSDDTSNFPALEKAYQSIKKACSMESWYVHELGERLLQALLDQLGAASNNPAQQFAIATYAFKVTEELLSSGDSSNFALTTKSANSAKATSMEVSRQDSFVLRRILLLYKSIKLRLFLNIRPEQGMQELHQVISPACATFFPSHHEMMQQIRQDCSSY